MASALSPAPSPPFPSVLDPSAIFSPSSRNFPIRKLYTPIHIRKDATYAPYPAGHMTTIQAPWGPMTMQGSYYLVEDSVNGAPGMYGSTVEAWRETNRLVEGEVEGRGVWVKVGLVRAVQLADRHHVSEINGHNEAGSKVMSSNPREAAETEPGMSHNDNAVDDDKEAAGAAESLLSVVPMPGMRVLTPHNGNVETKRIMQVGDWVVRQEDSTQKEVMVLSDANFRARYKERREVDDW